MLAFSNSSIMTKFILLIILFLFTSTIMAQETGSFERTINFRNTDRELAYYIPGTYNGNKSYPLIVALHGCNGNAIAFRNSMIYTANTLNAIVVSPDFMGEQMSGNKGKIITDAIEFTKNQLAYKIKSDQVYLLGYSCNGLETYNHGWSDLYEFAGIIPFNAWIPSTEGFNFNSKTPTCACSGTKDGSYKNNTLFIEKLIAQKGKGKLITMEGIGHSWNFSSRNQAIIDCFKWFSSMNKSGK